MKNKWVLLVILSLAFLFRVVGLNNYPVGFTPDEASFGYDAYSILKTGKDQWGNSFPLVLKSFGDYKAPVYAYLTIPFVALFDLTKFAVRLPNALLGTASVYIVYLLAIELFKRLQLNKNGALLVTLLVALSPWHIMMSRGAFEANLITFFLPLGIYLFLKEKYSLSAVVVGLSMFTYHSAKLIAPLVFVLLLILYKKQGLFTALNLKTFIKPVLIFSFFLILTATTFFQGAGERVKDINIFSGAIEEGSEAKNAALNAGEPYLISKVFHNKFTVSFDRFLGNYVQYFSPQFLLTKGPAETTYGMMPGVGVLNWVEFVGLFAFVVYILKLKDFKVVLFLTFWLLVSVIPASLAAGFGYAGNRAVAMIPVLQIIASIGLLSLVEMYKHAKPLLITLGVISFILFFEKYLFISPSKSAEGMLYGNLEVSNHLMENNQYDRVIVSTSLSEPHIYIAFAERFDSVKYQEATKSWKFEEVGLKWVDQLPEYSLGKYIFRRYNWRDGINENNLVVGRPDEFLENTETNKTINYPNGKPSIYVKSN